MQLHYHNTSLTQFLPSGPSCISQPSIHPFLSTYCIFILGCVFENPFTASCHWLSRWLQMCGLFFFLDHLCGTKNCHGVFSFTKSFCICDMHPLYLFFFNFLIFCWIKNHRFVRRKILSFWFLSNLCGSNLMLSFFSGRKYLSLYDSPYALMFVW